MSVPQLVSAFRDALEAGRLVKLHLSGYRGPETDLLSVQVRRVELKDGPAAQFLFRYKKRDETRNTGLQEAPALAGSWLQAGHYSQVQLFSTKEDLHLDLQKLDKPKLHRKPPSVLEIPDATHDRKKKAVVQGNGGWMHALGLADEKGTVFKNAQDKYRQIQHFASLLEPEISGHNRPGSIMAFDMGSGKGYLTFAVYELLKKHYPEVSVTGVELRKELVDFCNEQAIKSGLDGLKFLEGSIETNRPESCDLLMALHACDTATDDALWAGIQSGAFWIVAAPCCHKEIRKQIEGKDHGVLAPVSRYGVFVEREAEMITDAIRALLLEFFGYRVKVLEFVSDAHTPKNVMLFATRTGTSDDRKSEILTELNQLKALFGISRHTLEEHAAARLNVYPLSGSSD